MPLLLYFSSLCIFLLSDCHQFCRFLIGHKQHIIWIVQWVSIPGANCSSVTLVIFPVNSSNALTFLLSTDINHQIINHRVDLFSNFWLQKKLYKSSQPSGWIIRWAITNKITWAYLSKLSVRSGFFSITKTTFAEERWAVIQSFQTIIKRFTESILCMTTTCN